MQTPRIIFSATSSGCGKTTIVAGILAALKNRGIKSQPYKIGPDYIDPGYHRVASGNAVHNLDSWLVPPEKLKQIFFETSRNADVSIIEGVMGLYDGGSNGISSTAEISKLLDVPVILILDVKSQGISAAATAFGFKNFDPNVKFAGVILNRVGSDSHRKMIEDELKKIGIESFGALKRDESLKIPERHLGLVTASESDEIFESIEKIRIAVENQIDIDKILESIGFEKKPRIAVARDEVFSFYYPESLSVLEKFGAELVFFSPLRDEKIPECDGLIIGGGFPEMFAEQLEKNSTMRESILQASKNFLPIIAECGGFMYLSKSITDFDGRSFEMAGVFETSVEMEKKLQTVGYISATLQIDSIIGLTGDKFHAHEFHFSKEIESNKNPLFECERVRNGQKYFAGRVEKNTIGSYLHFHFAGSESIAKNFVAACKKFSRGEF